MSAGTHVSWGFATLLSCAQIAANRNLIPAEQRTFTGCTFMLLLCNGKENGFYMYNTIVSNVRVFRVDFPRTDGPATPERGQPNLSHFP
uniref:Putative secreted protein n=1 Tax=Anopheles darlingi TaxID=43151 RepID=A0A2M4D391_ANODA